MDTAKSTHITSNTEPKTPNNLKHYREKHLMSKAELSRRAGLSVITIGRIEQGYPCRLDTMRKIILGLGLKLTDKEKIFST